MDLDEIKQILELMREHDLAEFELERDSSKVKLRKQCRAAVRRRRPGGAASHLCSRRRRRRHRPPPPPGDRC